jgi:hypothetical protein
MPAMVAKTVDFVARGYEKYAIGLVRQMYFLVN